MQQKHFHRGKKTMASCYTSLKICIFFQLTPKTFIKLKYFSFQGGAADVSQRARVDSYCQSTTHFRTLQPRRCCEQSQTSDNSSHSYNNYQSFTLLPNNCSSVTNTFSRENISNYDNQCPDQEVKEPLLSPASAPTTISTVSSTLSSSELNHSLTSSDTSEFSQEKDRESEV